MKRTIFTILIGGAFLCAGILIAQKAPIPDTNLNAAGWVTLTNGFVVDWHPTTNFLTFASNRVHIEIGEGYHKTCLYKFTDDEWHLITNYWREHVVTNGLPMSYGGPIDHAPK